MGKGTILGPIHSKPPTKGYEETWDRVFKKKQFSLKDLEQIVDNMSAFIIKEFKCRVCGKGFWLHDGKDWVSNDKNETIICDECREKEENKPSDRVFSHF